jgi:pSer/pThr/pTyr-binding forkhead associated (FHA) protein
MEAKLTVVRGKTTKGSLSLKLPTVIGRSEEADLTVGHRTISRRHAELFETAGAVMIRDLGSTNGTIVDGQRIKEAPLPPGAEFTLGPLTFRVDYEYKGDRSKLPHAVLAEQTVNSEMTTQAATEFPDFEAVGEELNNKAPVKAPVVEKAAADKQGKKSQASTGDPFEDLLNELE